MVLGIKILMMWLFREIIRSRETFARSALNIILMPIVEFKINFAKFSQKDGSKTRLWRDSSRHFI
jgi:hypothetical protein